MARPTDYSPEIAAIVCERLADGESLRAICRDEDMPGRTTVWQWLAKFPEFANQYAHAREDQLSCLADEIVDIADDNHLDTVVDDDGRERVNHDVVARAKLRVDARKWVLSKLRPGTYGDRMDLNHGGSMNITLNGADADL